MKKTERSGHCSNKQKQDFYTLTEKQSTAKQDSHWSGVLPGLIRMPLIPHIEVCLLWSVINEERPCCLIRAARPENGCYIAANV